jgi:hypothetical protein
MRPDMICFEYAQKALDAAYRAQTEMAKVPSSYSDFDRLAINSAIPHLEAAAAELRCFAPLSSPANGLAAFIGRRSAGTRP